MNTNTDLLFAARAAMPTGLLTAALMENFKTPTSLPFFTTLGLASLSVLLIQSTHTVAVAVLTKYQFFKERPNVTLLSALVIDLTADVAAVFAISSIGTIPLAVAFTVNGVAIGIFAIGKALYQYLLNRKKVVEENKKNSTPQPLPLEDSTPAAPPPTPTGERSTVEERSKVAETPAGTGVAARRKSKRNSVKKHKLPPEITNGNKITGQRKRRSMAPRSSIEMGGRESGQ